MWRYNRVFSATSLLVACVLTSCSDAATGGNSSTEATSSWTLTGFGKVDSLNPILNPGPELTFTCPISNANVRWEERNVLNPAAVVKDGIIHLLYRAQDSSGTSRIGLATSTDGLHFNKHHSPVLYPSNDSLKSYEWNYKKGRKDLPDKDCSFCYFDGVEDPRIVESPEGTYIMTYTAYDGKTARLCLASSRDLYAWTKHGLVLKEEKYRDHWSKSGAIAGELTGNNVVAKKIDGKYWMYFGDTNIFLATSDDLINWKVCENEENGKAVAVLNPRSGYFDSRLVEPGPYALYTQNGILLIYNGSNAANYNDPGLPKHTYAAGQALYDKHSPYRLLDRTQTYFLHPDKEYERLGEVNEVCFVEGLVRFKDSWYLYYGTADSKIAVAVSDADIPDVLPGNF